VAGLTAFMLDQRQLHQFLTASFDGEQQAKQQPLLFPIFANLILELVLRPAKRRFNKSLSFRRNATIGRQLLRGHYTFVAKKFIYICF
jgi:hypothetical protein